MRVLVAGDVHGRLGALAERLGRARDILGIGAAIQVGDFGFFPYVLEQEPVVCFPVPVHALDGNHEDHRWLARTLRDGTAAAWAARRNLRYQPRPSVASIGGVRVGFLGGALHADRPQEHDPGGSPNYITPAQRERAVALFNRERPTVIVTHSCPSRIGVGVRGAPGLRDGVTRHIAMAGFDPGPPEDCGEEELRRLWEALSYRPGTWLFGHFHVHLDTVVDGTRFFCVAEEDEAGRPVIWDTATGRITA